MVFAPEWEAAEFDRLIFPKKSCLEGINQTDFIEGKKEKSNRESVIVYVGNEIWGAKWRNWKMMNKEIDRGGGEATRTYEVPLFYNLLLDPGEKYPLQEAEKNLWVRYPMSAALVKHLQSLQQEPTIKSGTPDPFIPKAK